MVNIDMNAPDRDMNPGVDLWRIESCVTARSSKGDAMLKLELARVSDPDSRIKDNIMLAGNGWGIGKQKLGAFVAGDFSGDFDPLDLVGKRVWVETIIKDWTYDGKSGQRLEVDINGLKHGGYQVEPPKGKDPFVEEVKAAFDGEEVPF